MLWLTAPVKLTDKSKLVKDYFSLTDGFFFLYDSIFIGYSEIEVFLPGSSFLLVFPDTFLND